MLEKLPITDDQMSACLKQTYGLTVTKIEFLPLGYDSAASVYRVWADGPTYFLKVKADRVSELSLLLPRYLQRHIAQIISPLPTLTRKLWGQVDGYTLILYPFIEGKAGSEATLSEQQWIEFGAVLQKLHNTRLPADLLSLVPRETFVLHPKWYALAHQLHDVMNRRTFDNPFQHQLAAFWQEQRAEINRILDSVERLSRRLQGQSEEMVLCHADIHTGNLLLDTQDRLFVVDWDQPLLAPKERDLMFVTVGGFVREARHEALFFQGYGPTLINPLVMAYYRYERVLEDLLEFAKQVFLVDSTDETKQDSIYWITRIFAPGGDVEAAHHLDNVLD